MKKLLKAAVLAGIGYYLYTKLKQTEKYSLNKVGDCFECTYFLDDVSGTAVAFSAEKAIEKAKERAMQAKEKEKENN